MRNNVKKEQAFTEHLAKVLQAHSSVNDPEEEEALIQLFETLYQLEPPINYLKRAEVQEVINNLNPNNTLGYDPITGKILKEVPISGIKYLIQLFNAVILILKPGKLLTS
jgi:hypothetical protein